MRARAGFQALGEFVQAGRRGKRPVDGYYVTMWRLMLRYPELLAWELLWTDSLRETYAAMYSKVKSIKPSVGVGWHIWHNNSFSPIYRAEQDLYGDVPPQELLDFYYRVLDYKQEKSLAEIPKAGFSADYVYREASSCSKRRAQKNSLSPN